LINISAILLAAGESTRMGRLKALLPWRGATLMEYQVNALIEAGVSEVVVVLGYRAETLRPLVERFPQARAVLNRRYRTGKSSSVRAGLRHADPDADAILVLAVDQPRSAEVVRRVIAAHAEMGTPITYPAYRGKGGHPILFSRTLVPEMLRIRESRQGLREVVERHRSEVAKLELDDPDVLLDLNKPEEYERAVG
jgi:molybdenum cofactor cytidylyltransferase